jgi:hypothetical protein
VSRYLPDFFTGEARRQIVGVAANGAAWLVRGAANKLAWRYASWGAALADGELAATIASVRGQFDGVSQTTIDWVLSPSLAPSWVQHPSLQIRSLAELQAVASARAVQLFGEPTEPATAAARSWAVSGDWHASQPFLCVAVPDRWRRALRPATGGARRQAASALGHPLTLALAAWRKQLPKDGWLAVATAGEIFVVYLSNTKLMRMRTLRIPTHATAASIELMATQEWQRETLRSQLCSAQLAWVNLSGDGGATAPTQSLKSIRALTHQHALATERPAIPDAPPDAQTISNEAMQAAWSAHLTSQAGRQ